MSQHVNGNKNSQDADVEHLGKEWETDNALQRIRTAGTISISPELFEKLYLQPRDAVDTKGLSRYFGNPTPIALVGFLLALSPLSNDLMNWRAAGANNGLANLGGYYFFGGMLMLVGALGEFIVGNTFPSVVFGSFSAFWLQYGATLQDGYFGVISGYAPMDGQTSAARAKNEFAFTTLWMGVLCLVYLIVSLRTNVVFVLIFLTLVFAFSLLTGAFWQLNNGYPELALRLQITGGAFAFLTAVLGWYLLTAILLASVDFPFVLPVGDLSSVIKGRKETVKSRQVEVTAEGAEPDEGSA